MRGEVGTTRRVAGFAVHVFTASGSVCALLAVLAILEGRFELAFGWLLLALFIDAIDGTLARAVSIEASLPRFSGERLDLIVDYVTYVFVPVLAMLRGGFLPGTWGLVTAAAILLSSLYHFSDNHSKADDYCFVGFPAVWNLVAFCIFAWGCPAPVAMVLCLGLAALTFVPMHWIHPMRVGRLFAMNVAVAGAGLIAGGWILATGFPGGALPGAVLALTTGYFVAMAVAWRVVGQGQA